MHTALIAGGAGFIGSHLCEFLLKNNLKVICVDNLSSGNLRNINNLFTNKNFTFLEHDIIEPFFLDCDYIYNLASPASPNYYQLDPINTTKVNVIGSFNLLDLAVKTNATILQASTSEIYGDPLLHPQKEEYFGNVNPVGIRSCYDEGKRCAESLFFDYHRKYGVKIKVVRIFNTYGPRLHSNDGRVISNFINQALLGDDITIYGSGSQTRSFCYIDDLIDVLYFMMNSENDILGPINIGNPEEFTIYDLAKKIISLCNSNSKIVFQHLPNDDPKMRKPDINKANILLNWSPKISLDTGLIRTINYFKSIL